MDKASPIHNITDFQLADAVRLARKRTPSDFKTILNYSKTLSDGLKIRRGYGTFSGIVYPTGLDASSCDVPIACPIKNPGTIDTNNPDRLDAFILCMASDPQVYMYPHWIGATKQDASMALAESLKPGFLGAAWSLQIIAPETSAHAFQILNANLFGFSLTTDFYKGWKIYNTITFKSTLVKSYTVSGTTVTFKCVDRLDASGLDFKNIHTYEFYHSYHDNHTFTPTYNSDLVNPPCAKADDSLIYFSGGQGVDPDASNSLRGSVIYPRMTKTFLPNVTEGGISRSFTIDRTYACEEQVKAYDLITTLDFTTGYPASDKNLDEDATYWLGLAPIYDGGMIGELQKYETTSAYGGVGATENYVSATTVLPIFDLTIGSGSLNKSLTGFGLYLAKDLTDTRSSGRQTSYFSVGYISLVSSDHIIEIGSLVDSDWVKTAQGFNFRFHISQTMWDNRGNTYEADSGMAETQQDTAYAYSGREIIGGRHYLYNVYVASESQADKQNIFTNPEGQNASINSGIIQTRIFPNERKFYRLEIEPNLGSKINAIVPRGFDEMLILKDRGIVDVRTTTTQDLIPELINRIVDHRIGCSTFHGYALSNQSEIFFAGYDDCYQFKGGELIPLIERGDKRDWLYTYREVITNAQKESATVIWLPQRYVMWDFGQTSGNQYILDEGGWTQAAYNQSSGLSSTEFFKFPSYLRNGTVIAVGTPGNTAIRQFQNPSTGAFYTTDAGIAIKAQLDTDYFNFGHDKDFVLNKIVFNASFDGTPSGQLDVSLYRDRLLVRVYTLDHTKYRRFLHSIIGDPKIGFEWRFLYNNNSSPEVQSGSQLQIDSVEIYGEVRSRSKRATEVTTVTDAMIWDADTWDGGKSWGS